MQKGVVTVCFSVTPSLRLVFLIPQWWWIQPPHWSLYLCVNSAFWEKRTCVYLKSNRLTCDSIKWRRYCVCLSAAHQRACAGSNSRVVRGLRQSGECVCVCGVGDRAGSCFPSLSHSPLAVSLFHSPGSIIFWVKRPTTRPSAAKSSSNRWPELNAGKCVQETVSEVKAEMCVCVSAVGSDWGEVLSAAGGPVSAGASDPLRTVWRLLHHHQQEASAPAESDGAAAGGELQVWGPSRNSATGLTSHWSSTSDSELRSHTV